MDESATTQLHAMEHDRTAFDEDAAPPAESSPFGSAASMATEILAATPEDPSIDAPKETPASPFISEDMTIIARGRRKRFRLH
jgi:hypothetical protein